MIDCLDHSGKVHQKLSHSFEHYSLRRLNRVSLWVSIDNYNKKFSVMGFPCQSRNSELNLLCRDSWRCPSTSGCKVWVGQDCSVTLISWWYDSILQCSLLLHVLNSMFGIFGVSRWLTICHAPADPLAMNDDALTPLDLARNRGHVNIVRMIEVFFSILFWHLESSL